MNVNPYEPPREAANHGEFDWRLLCIRSIWFSGACFAALMFIATMSAKPHTLRLYIVAWAGFISAWSSVIGATVAVIAGIGWAVSGQRASTDNRP